MKKALALILALVAVAAFAQDYTVDGEASVTWGYNLNDDSTGFQNSSDFGLTFTLVPETTTGTEGDGLYGKLTLADFELLVVDGKLDYAAADITAQIISGPLYLTIYSAPGFELNNAQTMGPLSIDAWEDASITADTAGLASGGIALGYTTDLFGVEVQVASDGDFDSAVDATADEYGWVDDDDDPTTAPVWAILTPAAAAVPNNVDNRYTFGFSATVTPIEMLAIEVAAFMDGWKPADGANKGLTLSATVTPIEGLEFGVAFDAAIVGTADLVWDLAGNVAYEMADTFSVGLNGYYGPKDSYGTVNDYIELGVEASVLAVENLGASVYFKAYDLMDSAELDMTDGLPAFVGGAFDYAVAVGEGTVTPYFNFDLGLLHWNDATALLLGEDLNGFAFSVGADIAVIANTVFNVDFSAGSISDDATTIDSITAFGKTADGFDAGTFTVTATISL
ncbi:MAG: hypothetical protein JXA15_13590 [Spirochaetales bacterium]|nr:hypothetical protein [Spirochaetales bacterium]